MRQKVLNKLYYVVFLLPVFLSLDFSAGLSFSAHSFDHPGLPSIPVSYLLFLMLSCLFFYRFLAFSVFWVFVIFFALAVFEYLFYGVTRQFILLFGMFSGVFVYFLLRPYRSETWREGFFSISCFFSAD